MNKKIAVIGSGISGLSAAWALRDTADVTLYEKADRLGGHAHTVDIEIGGATLPVDVGFIVANPLNYPNFMAFMESLCVETIQSDMSFSVSDPNGYEWSSNPGGLFAQKRNLFRLSYLKLLQEILKFNETARRDADADNVPIGMSLGQYLDGLNATERFRTNYILPMGAAIWSTPEAKMLDYPARSFLNFFNNHRLLHTERPKWRTVRDGSISYVREIAKDLGDRVLLGKEVRQIRKTRDFIEVWTDDGETMFDEVILACHADEARELLGDGYEHQKSILSDIHFIDNTAYLHSDPSLMPKRKAAWASWNVLKSGQKAVSLTYWMNKLQKLKTDTPVFVTLNPSHAPAADKLYQTFEFTHPAFDLAMNDARDLLERANGRNGLWFAGAWLGHGFHEDGLKSGLRVALELGGRIPWTPVGIAPFPKVDEETNFSTVENITAAAQ